MAKVLTEWKSGGGESALEVQLGFRFFIDFGIASDTLIFGGPLPLLLPGPCSSALWNPTPSSLIWSVSCSSAVGYTWNSVRRPSGLGLKVRWSLSMVLISSFGSMALLLQNLKRIMILWAKGWGSIAWRARLKESSYQRQDICRKELELPQHAPTYYPESLCSQKSKFGTHLGFLLRTLAG